MSPYVYHDLPEGSGLIRLLTIQAAADPEQTIFCSISVQALESKPQYDALSYVWGDQNVKVPVKLNGNDFSITTNLHKALKCVRQRDNSVVMWIDAICINQDSTADRDTQVQMMGSIYRSAQTVIVWLGTDPTTGQLAADMVHFWAHKKLDSIPPLGTVTDKYDETVWTALVQVLRCPWWSRMWTYQEYVLAREVVFMFGTTQVNDFVLFTASLAWDNQHQDKEKDGLNLDQIRLLQDGLDEMRYLRLAKERYGRLNRPDEPAGDLLMLQDATHERESHDPRDKIYALLGLSEAVGTGPDVDYSRSVEETYIRFAQNTVQSRQDLHILQYASVSVTPNSVTPLDIPSWVPDFRASAIKTLKLPLGQIANAGNKVLNPQFGVDGRILTCAGLVVDEITSVTHAAIDDSFDIDLKTMSEEERRYMQAHHSNMAVMMRIFKTLRLDCYGAGKPRTESMGWQQTWQHAIAWAWLINPAFLATIGCDHDTVSQKASVIERTNSADPYVQQFRLWLARIMMKLIPSNTVHPLAKSQYPVDLFSAFDDLNLTEDETLFHVKLSLAYISARLRNRALFGTSRGFFGNGPAPTQPGDMLCVLFGCPVPMILRPNSDGTHQVVGGCFVADLMQGEAVETWNASGAACQTFKLS